MRKKLTIPSTGKSPKQQSTQILKTAKCLPELSCSRLRVFKFLRIQKLLLFEDLYSRLSILYANQRTSPLFNFINAEMEPSPF
jgi:hypothetical protein